MFPVMATELLNLSPIVVQPVVKMPGWCNRTCDVRRLLRERGEGEDRRKRTDRQTEKREWDGETDRQTD